MQGSNQAPQQVAVNMPRGDQFAKLIKIRIGEPITAIDVRGNQIVFGAISGYIGLYNLESRELKYVQEVFEEIVRGIYIREDGRANVAIGDVQALVLNLADPNNKRQWDKFTYQSHEKKTLNECASTISFLKEFKVTMLVCSPTQNKDAVIDWRTYKQKFQTFSIRDGRLNTYTHGNVPAVCVPFDYDGTHIVLMEYFEKREKALKLFDIENGRLIELIKWGTEIDFVSHVRKIGNLVVYVVNHTQVYYIDVRDLQAVTPAKFLYKHNENIQAIDVRLVGAAARQSQPQQHEQEGEIEFKKHVENEEGQDLKIENLVIATIDYNMVANIFLKGKVSKSVELLKVPAVNETILKHKYIFDMGYPYYMRYENGVLAFSSDIGICIYQI